MRGKWYRVEASEKEKGNFPYSFLPQSLQCFCGREKDPINPCIAQWDHKKQMKFYWLIGAHFIEHQIVIFIRQLVADMWLPIGGGADDGSVGSLAQNPEILTAAWDWI